jgi:hypothetical protein
MTCTLLFGFWVAHDVEKSLRRVRYMHYQQNIDCVHINFRK